MTSQSFSRPGQLAWMALTLASFAGCGSREGSPPAVEAPATAPAVPAAAPAAPVQIEMKNIRLHLDDGIVLNVRHLRGEMVSTAREAPVFDDPRSYVLRVFTGDVGMDMTSLTNLMNRHVFAYENAPLKDISVEIDEGKLKQKGKLHKAVWVPFSMKATVGATPDGRLLLHTESVSALGIPATKLLDLFGLTLADLMTVEKQRGVEIKDDDVIISPGRVLPPPQIQGHLSRAEVANGELREVFTTTDGRAVPDPHSARSEGAELLLFLRLDHPLREADDDRGRPPAHRRRRARSVRLLPGEVQRAARRGLFEEHAGKGLRTYMPDFADLKPGLDLRPPR